MFLKPLTLCAALTLSTAALATPTVIQASAEGHTIMIQMNDSSEAKQFLAMLPARIRMADFGGREYYGPSPKPVSTTSKGQYTFENGTLTYCPTNDTVAIFYAQTDRPRLTMAVHPMGHVTSSLEVFEKLPTSTVFEFKKAP